MASLLRLILILLNLVSIPIYLIFIISEGILFQIAGAIVILLLLSLLLFTGKRVQKQPAINDKKNQESIIVGEVELPPVVTSEQLEIPESSKEITRSRGRTEIINLPPIEIEPPTPNVAQMKYEDDPESKENVEGLAKLYVATSDPDSQHELEVEQFIATKRDMRNKVKDRLTKERRMSLAKNVSKKVAQWAELEDGEDFTNLLNNENSEITILTEPEEYDFSIPQGISFVRIDTNRIVKIRVSLAVKNNSLLTKLSDNGQFPSPSSFESNSTIPEPSLPPPIGFSDNQSLDNENN